MGFRNRLNFPPGSITAAMLADGSVTGPKLSFDAIDGKTITGAFIRTAATGQRWEIDAPGFSDQIRGYTGAPGEIDPASLTIAPGGSSNVLALKAPKLHANNPAELDLQQIDAGTGEWVLISNGGGRFVDSETLATLAFVDQTGRYVGPGGISTVAYSGTTDANGFLTITHNSLFFTPQSGWTVTTNPGASFAQFWGIDTITTTTCRVRFANAGGGPLISAAVVGRLYLVHP